jgi:ubiquinone/menaquinone biosynthesis C-methylase UbiE
MNLEDIRRHWERAGEQLLLQETVTSTSRDPFLGQLEEDYILRYLHPNQNVLEVGCGDASHTIKYAQRVKYIWALDVAGSLIERAKQRVEVSDIANIEFTVGSILEAGVIFCNKPIDCVISQRCLINLPTWHYQQDAIVQIHQLLKTGGLFLMTEGFQDELDNLNQLRERVGLSRIDVVGYNRNLIHDEFDAFIGNYFEIDAMLNYGLYLLLSRVYHPLVMVPEQPKHDSRFNEVAGLLSREVPTSEFRQYSYNLLYVLRKR